MRLGHIWRLISLLDLLFLIFKCVDKWLEICIRSSPIYVNTVDAARLPELDLCTLYLYLQHTILNHVQNITYLTSFIRLISLGSGVSFDLPTASCIFMSILLTTRSFS
jgi:hypothetical protein